jgi:hypothetical protein
MQMYHVHGVNVRENIISVGLILLGFEETFILILTLNFMNRVFKCGFDLWLHT